MEVVEDVANDTLFANISNPKDEKSALTAFNSDGTVKWSVPGGKYVRYLRLVPDGKGGVFAQDRLTMTSYDANGKEQWSYAHCGGQSHLHHSWDGQRPWCGKDGTVYFVSARSERSRKAGVNDENLSVVAVKDGKKQWEYMAANNVNNNPGLTMRDDGKLLVAVQSEAGFFTGKKNYLVCLNPDGTIHFKHKFQFKQNWGASYPTPAADGSTYLMPIDGENWSVKALTPGGREKWTCIAKGYMDFPPTDDGCGQVYIPNGENKVTCLDSDTGQEKWTASLPGKARSAVLCDNGRVTIMGDGDFYDLDDKGNITGTEKQGNNGNTLQVTVNGTYYVFDYKSKRLERLETPSPDEMRKKKAEAIAQMQNEAGEVIVEDNSVSIDGVTLKRH